MLCERLFLYSLTRASPPSLLASGVSPLLPGRGMVRRETTDHAYPSPLHTQPPSLPSHL